MPIKLRDLTLGYDGHPAVHHLDGTIEIRLRSGRQIAYLPQSAEIDRSFPATVADLVSLGHWRTRGLWGAITGPDYNAMREALEAVGLAGFENRPLDTLSGGQAQRALFARVMLQDSDVILLDEPFTAIDEKTVADLVQLVRRWHSESRTVVAVLHDIEMVREFFPQALLMAREPVAWGPVNEALKPENMLKARRMTEAWDEHAPWHDPANDGHHGHKHEQGAA
jgi:zinc/manganese transport system ATP-binding protein